MSKRERHAQILDVIKENRVTSQEALRELLLERGTEVTQATLSRDLRLLGLTKIANADGGSRYAAPSDVGPGIRPQLEQLLPTLLVSLDAVGPFLVLKTVTGGAQSLGGAVDGAGWPEVIGTIGGDDTLLVIMKSERARRAVHVRLKELAGLPD